VATPTVAVIVATRDRPHLLADALASVAGQRAAPLEVRIANDGDLPAEDAVDASGLLEVTVIPVSVRHTGTARNLAAASARADVLAFLDDDDRWLPGHLEGLVGAFADPSCAIAYRDSVVVRERLEEDGRRVELGRRALARGWDAGTMAENDYVPPSALAVRRDLFERLQGFDPDFAYSEDWDFLLRAAAHATPRRVAGQTVEVRLRDRGNASADVGPERRACLDRLSARHRLPALAIKTFWEVAGDLAGPAAGGAR
jgi:glycosyltransferase involved in cell wall biosynthesis